MPIKWRPVGSPGDCPVGTPIVGSPVVGNPVVGKCPLLAIPLRAVLFVGSPVVGGPGGCEMTPRVPVEERRECPPKCAESAC